MKQHSKQQSNHLGAAGINAFRRGQDTYYYHQDEQLSAVYITGRNKGVLNHYQYEAFGAELESAEQVPNRLRYMGQQAAV